MPQITGGIRSFLSRPRVYKTFQYLLGEAKYCRTFVRDYFSLVPAQRILDIGCGTANILKFLPDSVEYVGFDASSEYIDYARKIYQGRKAFFFTKRIEQTDLETLGSFDLVISLGVLHHLDDNHCLQLFALTRAALNTSGRLCTVDPCLVERQNRLSRKLMQMDRGQNIRTPEQYGNVAKKIFNEVEVQHRKDLLRFPYDLAVLLCKA
jgi:SAM-dependent methyltransferase